MPQGREIEPTQVFQPHTKADQSGGSSWCVPELADLGKLRNS